jgi:pentatricopeptide repeat protein
MDDAMDKFNDMIDMGVPHGTTVYQLMIEGYLKHGDSVKAMELITQMKTKDIRHNPRKGNGRT